MTKRMPDDGVSNIQERVKAGIRFAKEYTSKGGHWRRLYDKEILITYIKKRRLKWLGNVEKIEAVKFPSACCTYDVEKDLRRSEVRRQELMATDC